MYVQLHSAMEGLQSLQQNLVQVAMVDAEHDYVSVRRHLTRLWRSFIGLQV
jgi:hypothetical protein